MGQEQAGFTDAVDGREAREAKCRMSSQIDVEDFSCPLYISIHVYIICGAVQLHNCGSLSYLRLKGGVICLCLDGFRVCALDH